MADKIENAFPEFEAVARKAHAEPQNQDAQRALAARAAEVYFMVYFLMTFHLHTVIRLVISLAKQWHKQHHHPRNMLPVLLPWLQQTLIDSPQQSNQVGNHWYTSKINWQIIGDVAAAEKALAQLRGPGQANLEILRAIAEQSGDPAAAASAAKAAGLLPQLVTASYHLSLLNNLFGGLKIVGWFLIISWTNWLHGRVGAIKNPADKNQKAKVAELAAATKQALAETVAAYPNTDELLVANAEKVNASLAKLGTSAKSGIFCLAFFHETLYLLYWIGDAAGANAALEAAQSALSQQSLYARAVAHQAPTPEAKSAIMKDAESVEKLLPELATTGKAAIAKPQDVAAQQKLATVSNKAKDINKNLADHGRAAQQQRLERYSRTLITI